MWMLYLGLINLVLLLFSFFVFFPKDFFKIKYSFIDLFQFFKKQIIYFIIIFAVVAFHLIEVRFIDPVVTDWINYDFANTIKAFEGDFVYSFSQHWFPGIVHFFVIIYIAIYPFTLWFCPLYFIFLEKKQSIKALAYGLLIIYLIALPFYLFLPITNVYNFYNVNSALETVFPSVENFFYSTTTINNCLPSLHTAMTILVAYSVYLTGNKKFTYFAYFVMICVILSVIYLSIHWLTDVLTGGALALVTIFLLHRFILKKEKDE
jgi:hypothetical protein